MCVLEQLHFDVATWSSRQRRRFWRQVCAARTRRARECTVPRPHGKSKAARAQWLKSAQQKRSFPLPLNKRRPGAPRPFEAAGRRSQAGLYAGCGDRHNNQRDAANIFMWIKSEI